MDMPNLQAEIRKNIGNRLNSLRNGGVLPAVLYGYGVSSTPLSIPMRDFEKVLHEAGETSLVSLEVEEEVYNVLIHDVATDPMTLKPIHADFYAVRMDRLIEAKVPLHFIGESSAVKNLGGILVKVVHELEVKALPKDLPHEITIDVSQLSEIGSKIHVSDISLPHGVAAEADAEEVVALVEAPRSEEELEALSKPEEAAAVEVKTEREVKVEKEVEAEEETAPSEEK